MGIYDLWYRGLGYKRRHATNKVMGSDGALFSLLFKVVLVMTSYFLVKLVTGYVGILYFLCPKFYIFVYMVFDKRNFTIERLKR